MFKLVATVQTAYSQFELCKALIQAWYNEYKALPSKQSVGIIISQNLIETGGKYFWNNNWGNVKVGNDDPNQVIEYMMLKNVWEISNGVKVMYQPPARQTWFRAFATLDEGVRFQFNLLQNGRYHQAWYAIEQGNLVAFAHELKIAGYYTAPEQDYINGMTTHYNNYNNSGNYEKALAEFNVNNIEFPPDYKPVDLKTFNIIDDTADKPNNTVITVPATTGNFIMSIKNKFKTIFNTGK